LDKRHKEQSQLFERVFGLGGEHQSVASCKS